MTCRNVNIFVVFRKVNCQQFIQATGLTPHLMLLYLLNLVFNKTVYALLQQRPVDSLEEK